MKSRIFLEQLQAQKLTAKKEVFRTRERICSVMCIHQTATVVVKRGWLDIHQTATVVGWVVKRGGLVMANKLVAHKVAHLVAHKVAHLVAHLVGGTQGCTLGGGAACI